MPPASPPTRTRRLARLRHFLRRRWPHLLWAAPLLGLLAICGVHWYVRRAAAGLIYDSVDTVPPAPVALVLGSSANAFTRARVRAAAALFAAGKVRGILVSGDNGQPDYNEPQAMRRALVALGVPPQYITLDYAGFRTLDSVVRARRVFGLDHVVIVSQRFHVERALYLARHHGLRAVGFAARDVAAGWTPRMEAREVLARALAVVDTAIIRRAPRFLGKPETVALRPPDATAGK